MRTYSKINTLYVRDKHHKVTGELTRPVYATIDKWIVREKVDGVNMRIGFTRDLETKDVSFTVTGRSDDADLPTELIDHCTSIAEIIKPVVSEIMTQHGLTKYILFGEGYGAGIHHGGRYSSKMNFALFDVAVDEGCTVCEGKPTYLSEAQVDATAERLGINVVPRTVDEFMTLDDIVDMVKAGFPSVIADEWDPEFYVEGIVAKTVEPLYDNRGERVMFKLKSRDFPGWSKKGVKL